MDRMGMGGVLIFGWIVLAGYLLLLLVASGVIGAVGAFRGAAASLAGGLRREAVRR